MLIEEKRWVCWEKCSRILQKLNFSVHAGPEDLEGFPPYEFIGLHIPAKVTGILNRRLERSIILINVDRTITLGAPHGWDPYSLMIYELGHAAGLDDTGYHEEFPIMNENTGGYHVWNTMHGFMNRGSLYRRTLGSGDIAGLNAHYN